MTQPRRFQYTWELAALLGLAIYIAKSIYFAHSSLSIGDEGAYLFKGLMFARGEYRPFQDYGFWTNKTPLAFLIPGYIQYWFGAGLREARYFAIAVSILMLSGLWITANRLGGRQWAAIAVWVFALSDAHVATYSLALSQGLVACMMSWMFVCTLGDDRPIWQLILGTILSVCIVMTRQNMILVPLLLILYVFWQSGSKAGWWTMGTGATLFVGFHALYWPQILQIWAPWLTQVHVTFLNQNLISTISAGASLEPDAYSRWQAFAIGVREHSFVLCGSMSAVILWIRKAQWKSLGNYKSAVFLGILYLILFLMHMWGSLFNIFCVQCFTSYQMFFSITGFLFVLVVFSNGLSPSTLRLSVFTVWMLVFSAIVGMSYFSSWGEWLLDTIRLPRISTFLSDGLLDFATLRDVLTYVLQMEPKLQLLVTSAAGGALAGAMLLLTDWLIRRIRLAKDLVRYPANVSAVTMFLLASLMIPASLNLMENHTSCSTEFITYYEQAGRKLAENIPSGNLVYWKGSGRHLALLLYATDIRYFPPQITAGGGYYLGDSDQLLKRGMYNQELDQQWKETADFFIIWRFFPTILFDEFQDQTKYQPIPFDMDNLRGCEEPLYLFKKIP